MNPDDRDRLLANQQWFSELYDGIRQFFGLVVEKLLDDFLPDDFSLSSGNYYYPRQNYAPTMPTHYVLMLRGRSAALQGIAVLDPQLMSTLSRFTREPSIVVLLLSRPELAGQVANVGLKVISGSGVDYDSPSTEGVVTGTINSKPTARFSAMQFTFDQLSDAEGMADVLRQIVALVVDHLPEE